MLPLQTKILQIKFQVSGDEDGAGHTFACALLENGSVGCWGSDNHGQQGTGNIGGSSVQIKWPLLPQNLNVVSISAGNEHVCAIMDDHSLYCWGRNNYGQVGVGNTSDIPSPTMILNASHQVVGVTTGYPVVLLAKKWFRPMLGLQPLWQLSGNVTQMESPAWVMEHSLNEKLKIITMHNTLYNTCAMYDNGAISCWGQGQTYYSKGDGSAVVINQTHLSTINTLGNDGSHRF